MAPAGGEARAAGGARATGGAPGWGAAAPAVLGRAAGQAHPRPGERERRG